MLRLLVSGVNGDAGFTALACVMNEIQTSDALISRIDATTAMQGQQTATEKGLNYTWS